MAGKISRVSIGFTVETDKGPRKTIISLTDFRRHCRAERVKDLLDDLQLLCEDVHDAREADDRRNAPKVKVLR